jgi:Abnormal spindle-like microcephaly-assoc'd, ASPM-SPD-2-Hydin
MATPTAGLAAPESAEPPQLAIEPGSYDFGLQPLNWGTRETWFQLRNVGTETLQVGAPEVAGSGHEAFWADYSSCYGSYLNPGEACSVRVYFSPDDAVEYTAQYRVSVGSYSFAADLTGTGGRASFSPDSSPTDFGVVPVGSAGATREIAVTNTGNMPGGVFIAVIAGGAIGSFQLLDENCTGVELAPGATCTLQVRFQPVSEGVKKAMLGLFGDNEGPTPIVLTGVGSAPEPDPGQLLDSSAGESAATPALGADRPRAKPARNAHRQRIRRRHRRANLHAARRALAADVAMIPLR